MWLKQEAGLKEELLKISECQGAAYGLAPFCSENSIDGSNGVRQN